ncbi:MAG: biotin/lipoyl-binding protein [Ruthenibacterium sp.]
MITRKTKIVKIAVTVAILLLVCTVASRTVYNLLLPEVSAQTIKGGSLLYSGTFSGTVKGDANGTEITAADTWNIKEVLVTEGQMVAAGDALFLLDVQSSQIRLKQMQASIQQKKNALNGTNWTGGDRLVLETELQALEMQYAEALGKFLPSGKVTAPISGQVSGLAKVGTVPAGTVLATIAGEGSQNIVAWSAPVVDAKKVLAKGVTLTCTFSALSGTGDFVLKDETCGAKITAASYDEDAGLYNLQAMLKTETAVPVGTPVQIKSSVKSEQYDALVPLPCLMTDTDGSKYILLLHETASIWGLSTQVQKQPVTVVESNHLYAAIETDFVQGAQLAAYPSRMLVDGETVCVVKAS